MEKYKNKKCLVQQQKKRQQGNLISRRYFYTSVRGAARGLISYRTRLYTNADTLYGIRYTLDETARD